MPWKRVSTARFGGRSRGSARPVDRLEGRSHDEVVYQRIGAVCYQVTAVQRSLIAGLPTALGKRHGYGNGRERMTVRLSDRAIGQVASVIWDSTQILIDQYLPPGMRELGMHGPVEYSTRRSGTAMGIYDREYYRGETGGPSWFSGVAPWCKTLIVINCVAFLLQNALRGDSPLFEDWLEASPEAIFQHGRIWQLWTATFLHSGILHILGNMWFLWLVGREMESLYGSRDFLAFYLLAGGSAPWDGP